MATKIDGLQNRPVQVGAEKPVVLRPREAGAIPSTAAGGSPVHITDQARRLAALEHAVQSAPDVNEARVAEIRSAIEEGRYEISPQRIAEKLLRLDQELN